MPVVRQERIRPFSISHTLSIQRKELIPWKLLITREAYNPAQNSCSLSSASSWEPLPSCGPYIDFSFDTTDQPFAHSGTADLSFPGLPTDRQVVRMIPADGSSNGLVAGNQMQAGAPCTSPERMAGVFRQVRGQAASRKDERQRLRSLPLGPGS